MTSKKVYLLDMYMMRYNKGKIEWKWTETEAIPGTISANRGPWFIFKNEISRLARLQTAAKGLLNFDFTTLIIYRFKNLSSCSKQPLS